MGFLIVKYIVTAGLVVLISEAAKRSDKLGAVIAALPLVTVLTLLWMHLEKQPPQKISNHAYYTFWYVLPTLPMFVAFPWLLSNMGFWGALGASLMITAGTLLLLGVALRSLGVELF